MGADFEVRPSGVEELTRGDPAEVALENARRKARAVAQCEWGAGGGVAGDEVRAGEPSAAVLGVDTLVALDGRIYGQPADEEAARTTLRALGGRTHTVVSGLVLVSENGERSGIEETAVTFRELDDAAIDSYLATGEWRGRAGAYAIQERGGALVRRVEGDYLNIVGLPFGLLLDLASS
ncbi:MAG: Maf family protein [Solirubrobacteraceae bacterium]